LVDLCWFRREAGTYFSLASSGLLDWLFRKIVHVKGAEENIKIAFPLKRLRINKKSRCITYCIIQYGYYNLQWN
jgi:hypothetical protein